jgi:hypothetical protein
MTKKKLLRADVVTAVLEMEAFLNREHRLKFGGQKYTKQQALDGLCFRLTGKTEYFKDDLEVSQAPAFVDLSSLQEADSAVRRAMTPPAPKAVQS